MRIQRTIPPAAAPIYLRDFLNGLKGLIRGRKETERFRSELKEYFGVKHCFLLSSGRAALTIVLRALKDSHPERDGVLIPAFTCFAVPSAIVRAGLKVRLCDVNPDTLGFDHNQLSALSSELSAENSKPTAMSHEPRFSERLLAVIPTHLFGIPADVEKVKTITNDPDICIIEDAAQAMGGECDGTKVGTIGDVGIFSLGRGKTFSTIEGGVIVTDRDDIGGKILSRIRLLKRYRIIELVRVILNTISLSFFLNPLLFWFPKSLPFLKLGETTFDPEFRMRRMSSFQAGLARHWKKKLHRFRSSRIKNSEFWQSVAHSRSHELSAISCEPGLPLIRFPVSIKNAIFRDRVLNESQQSGLGIMPTYPNTVDGIDELKEQFSGMQFPSGQRIVEELVTLPTHPFVSKKDREKIRALLSNGMRSS